MVYWSHVNSLCKPVGKQGKENGMTDYTRALSLFALAIAGTLFLVACRPVDTPRSTPMNTPTVTPPVAPTPTPQPPPGGAANADVTYVRAVQTDAATWTFHVTVEHPDTGWEDYADGWDVLTPDGTVLKPDPAEPFTRLLLHPHVGEQPFTRSQSGIVIPEGVTQVRVRAHDLVDGFGGREVLVDLTVESGTDFRIERQE
jgi:hypothetical protein